LRKTTAASRFFAWLNIMSENNFVTQKARAAAYVWLHSSMESLVDIETCLFIKTHGAVLDCALVVFLATLWAAGFLLKILLRELELTRFPEAYALTWEVAYT
jgi:hypothetical protein